MAEVTLEDLQQRADGIMLIGAKLLREQIKVDEQEYTRSKDLAEMREKEHPENRFEIRRNWLKAQFHRDRLARHLQYLGEMEESQNA